MRKEVFPYEGDYVEAVFTLERLLDGVYMLLGVYYSKEDAETVARSHCPAALSVFANGLVEYFDAGLLKKPQRIWLATRATEHQYRICEWHFAD